MIDPYNVSLRCKAGHKHIYTVEQPGIVDCKTRSCNFKVNSSRVFRGVHPYIVWTGDTFQAETDYIQTFTCIPLTSKKTFAGLPTVYPLVNTAQNGLEKKSYVLTHQICTIDGNCFKDRDDSWSKRLGQLAKKDKIEVETRLKYFFSLSSEPDTDWFRSNATPALVKQVFDYLDDSEKADVLESLFGEIE